MIPAPSWRRAPGPDEVGASETLVFDKAEAAERLQRLQSQRSELEQALASHEGPSDGDASSVEGVRELARLRAELTRIATEIDEIETGAGLD